MLFTAAEYRKNLEDNPKSWAIVPKAMALKWLGITSQTFDKWVQNSKIQELRIKEVGRLFLAESVRVVLTETAKLKGKTRNALSECARKRDTTAYSDLMSRVGMAENFHTMSGHGQNARRDLRRIRPRAPLYAVRPCGDEE